MDIKRVLMILFCLLLSINVSYRVFSYNEAYVMVPAHVNITDDKNALSGFTCDGINSYGYIPILINSEGKALESNKKVIMDITNNASSSVVVDIRAILSTNENKISLSDDSFGLPSGDHKEVVLSVDAIRDADFSVDIVITSEGRGISSVIERTLRFKGY